MKIGFIGCGNMGSAMIRGMLGSGAAKAEDMTASALSEKSRRRIREELGIRDADNVTAAASADVLFLAVKPQFYEDVIREIAPVLQEETIVVTLAPGKTIAWLQEKLGRPLKIIRTMPNTPALTGEGMTGVCPSEQVTDEELEMVMNLLCSFGRARQVPERLMDVVTSVSGSSPAYVFIMIEAMADAAVADGMPRSLAYEFAAQAVLGSAKMVLESGLHPGQLKDQVCSPGGTTIEAVRILEAKGFRSALIEAMKACTAKSRNM